MANEPVCVVPMRIMNDLHRRLSALEAWKDESPPHTVQGHKRRCSRHATSKQLTNSTHGGRGEALPPTAASFVFQNAELVELILHTLDLPALRLLKTTCRSVASVARRVICSPEWLAAGSTSARNLYDIRRLFSSKRAFKLPMRVVIERYNPRSGAWTRLLGTLLHLRVGSSGRRDERHFWPVELRLEVDGEGLHEDPLRLLSHGNCLYTRLQSWDLSACASIVSEENAGLGLLRPVLGELALSCAALHEPPIVGPTVAELLSARGLAL